MVKTEHKKRSVHELQVVLVDLSGARQLHSRHRPIVPRLKKIKSTKSERSEGAGGGKICRVLFFVPKFRKKCIVNRPPE